MQKLAVLTVEQYSHIALRVKTTIDLPEGLLHRAKVTAAQRKTTLRDLVATGLDWVIRSSDIPKEKSAALDRLRAGLHLGGEPLTREEAHEPR